MIMNASVLNKGLFEELHSNAKKYGKYTPVKSVLPEEASYQNDAFIDPQDALSRET